MEQWVNANEQREDQVNIHERAHRRVPKKIHESYQWIISANFSLSLSLSSSDWLNLGKSTLRAGDSYYFLTVHLQLVLFNALVQAEIPHSRERDTPTKGKQFIRLQLASNEAGASVPDALQ